jgi:hypothetical protein
LTDLEVVRFAIEKRPARMPERPTVFISYAHESDDHAARVLAFADKLVADGIDVILDQYNPHPPQGWPAWMDDGLNRANFVLMVCSPAYYRRVKRREAAGKGLGVQWEGNLIYNALYGNVSQGDKFIPVLLTGFSPDDIPELACGFTRYQIDAFTLDDAGYERLYRHLTGQPVTPKPELGTLKQLPSGQPRAAFFTGPSGDIRNAIIVSVKRVDALEFPADVLVLKYAQELYGVDMLAVRRLESASPWILDRLPAVDDHLSIACPPSIAAQSVLFMGVPTLTFFNYKAIRQFTRRALIALKTSQPATKSIAFTLHGAGYGLDETEAFLAELAGIVDVVDAGDYPESLISVTFVELNAARAQRMQERLALMLPNGRIDGPSRKPALDNQADPLKAAGAQSLGKAHVFVAMPFLPEFDDRFHYGIQRAVNEAGYLCERADIASFTGDILDWIKGRIDTAKLMIADLTTASPNVYLEVGFAWGRGVPTVLLVSDTSELKFDVQGHRCLIYKSIRNLEEILTRELDQLKV